MKLFDDDEDPCPPKDDEARDRFKADMAEILADERRTECQAAREMREAAANSVDSTIRAYRCQHTDDGDGGCVGLADALSPIADATIRRGLDELRLLVDAVAGDIEALSIPPCDAYAHGRADALAEAAALIRKVADGAALTEVNADLMAKQVAALAPASPTHVSVRLEAVDRAVDDLFVNGAGERAVRLVLVDASGRDLGGWSREAILVRLRAALEGGET